MSTETEYLPIQNLDLEGDSEITFDLYISLPKNGRMILYRRQGEVIENNRLEKFSHQPDMTLHVHRKDYKKFVSYVSDRIGRLLNVTPENDTRYILGGVAKNMLNGTFEYRDPAMTRAMMANLNEVSSLVIDRVLEQVQGKGRKAYRSLLKLAATGTDFQKHPVNVASLTVMICFGIGFTSSKTLAEVAMAAILHDLGLAKIPAHVAVKAHTKELIPWEEKLLLNRHINLTFEVLKERGIQISDLTRLMIEQHHEFYNGYGLPNHLKGNELNTFAQILHMADEIDQAIFGANSESPMADLFHLFESWSKEKAFDPLLVSKIRTLFILG